MGWFDDSDDEEEKKVHSKALPTMESIMGSNGGSNQASACQNQPSVEEEDPLDAFMSNLQTTNKATAAASSASQSNEAGIEDMEERLDVQIEEEPRHKKVSSESNSKTRTIRTYDDGRLAPFQKSFFTCSSTNQGVEWRRINNVQCTDPIDPVLAFDQLGNLFGDSLLDAISKRGFQSPTLVQAQALPAAVSGRDVLITAATGQGKTMAYLWPLIVHMIDQPRLGKEETGPISLVLVPTRELANQVYLQAKTMLKAHGCTAKCVVGGQGKYLLKQELKKMGGVELVVATPGRLLDVLSDQKGLSVQRVTALVLDEADKMLQMGFETQVRQILSAIRIDRQTLVLSATMGRRVEKIATEWLNKDYVRISVGCTGQSSQNVDQHVIVLQNDKMKEEFLLELLPTLKVVGQTLVFVATKERCDHLSSRIENVLPDVPVAALHGDKHQSDRSAALRAFSRGQVSVLVATDVAGRGLDVPNISTVVNFDPAKDLDAHVHRVGRSGRLSKGEQMHGSAYTLLTPKNADFARVLKNSFEREQRSVPIELERLAEESHKKGNQRKHSKNTGMRFGENGKTPDRDRHLYGSLPDEPPNKRVKSTY